MPETVPASPSDDLPRPERVRGGFRNPRRHEDRTWLDVLRWKLKSDPDVQKQHPIWEKHLAIQVTKPLISIKDLKLSALLNTFIGSGLSIPFIYDRIKERKKKTPSKRKQKIKKVD